MSCSAGFEPAAFDLVDLAPTLERGSQVNQVNIGATTIVSLARPCS